jgi:arginine repressor
MKIPKIYIVRTKLKDGEMYYLKFINSSGTFAEYSKNLDDALEHTKEEMEYVKNHHLPGLGRWILLESEKKRLEALQRATA